MNQEEETTREDAEPRSSTFCELLLENPDIPLGELYARHFGPTNRKVKELLARDARGELTDSDMEEKAPKRPARIVSVEFLPRPQRKL